MHTATIEPTLEYLRLFMPLRSAAVAGMVLSFNPQNSEMRETAEKSWEKIRLLLSHHLLGEAEIVLPGADERAAFTSTMARRAKRRHAELRSLARRIDAVSFECGRNGEVAEAADALREFAIKLDDLVDGADRGLLPLLRPYVFVYADENGGVDRTIGS